jgi:hypothetical protein
LFNDKPLKVFPSTTMLALTLFFNKFCHINTLNKDLDLAHVIENKIPI